VYFLFSMRVLSIGQATYILWYLAHQSGTYGTCYASN
jgi:hypothetical protein